MAALVGLGTTAFTEKVKSYTGFATGTPIHPLSPLIRITWMKQQDPDRFHRTARFLSLKSYIIRQLTGDNIIDYSLASATGLFNIQHRQQHFIRSTIEGILCEIYSIGKMPGDHRAFHALSVNGSFTANPFWAQLIADIFNMPVHVKNNADSIGLGAFLLTATESGRCETLGEAARTVDVPPMYQPNRNDHGVYMRFFEIFQRLTARLGEDFAAIAEWQSHG